MPTALPLFLLLAACIPASQALAAVAQPPAPLPSAVVPLETLAREFPDRVTVSSRSGDTGVADRPQLHFEIRRGREPVDPLARLPRLG